MNANQIANIIGFAAAGIGIVMFMPQTINVWKTKNTKSLSLISFLLFGIASLLWTIYGIIMAAPPIIVVNVTLVILNFYIVVMKLKYK
jgi:MtN3 and saliva related transmembrane protein